MGRVPLAQQQRSLGLPATRVRKAEQCVRACRDYLAWRHTQPGQEPVQAWSLVRAPHARSLDCVRRDTRRPNLHAVSQLAAGHPPPSVEVLGVPGRAAGAGAAPRQRWRFRGAAAETRHAGGAGASQPGAEPDRAGHDTALEPAGVVSPLSGAVRVTTLPDKLCCTSHLPLTLPRVQVSLALHPLLLLLVGQHARAACRLFVKTTRLQQIWKSHRA